MAIICDLLWQNLELSQMIGLVDASQENGCLEIFRFEVDVGDKVDEILENFFIAGWFYLLKVEFLEMQIIVDNRILSNSHLNLRLYKFQLNFILQISWIRCIVYIHKFEILLFSQLFQVISVFEDKVALKLTVIRIDVAQHD